MQKIWDSIFLNFVFYICTAVIAVLFVIGHFYPLFHTIAQFLFLIFIIVFIVDFILLFRLSSITGRRKISSILSNGDVNYAELEIDNNYPHRIHALIHEELPFQLNIRDLHFPASIEALSKKKISYSFKPVERGEYLFGDIVVMTMTPISIIKRKYVVEATQKVSVYPSYSQLTRYSLRNFRYYTNESGSKRTRKIGHSMEFEQIKDYVKGDDIRHINWKASAKKDHWMVNQYIDERSQDIYCIIDTGRVMQMPFDGLSLLDYAINSSLAMSHIIVRNYDRAGLIYFNKKIDKILPADKSTAQIPRILNLLYNLKTEFYESNFEKLYSKIKFKITHRSLLLLFTNFEDMNSLKRQLPYLKGIAKNNVLLVIFFKNSAIEKLITKKVGDRSDYYLKAISEKFSFQKKLMAKELQKHGIQTLLTDPYSLTMDTVNKYLEIKARALI